MERNKSMINGEAVLGNVLVALDNLGIPYKIVDVANGVFEVADEHDTLVDAIIMHYNNMSTPVETIEEKVHNAVAEQSGNMDFAILITCKRAECHSQNGLVSTTTQIIGDCKSDELSRVVLTANASLYEVMVNKRYGINSIEESIAVAEMAKMGEI